MAVPANVAQSRPKYCAVYSCRSRARSSSYIASTRSSSFPVCQRWQVNNSVAASLNAPASWLAPLSPATVKAYAA